MVTTDVRTLMKFEFERALSYISEMIEIEKRKEQLRKKREILNAEFYDWRNEVDLTEEEKIQVDEIKDEIAIKLQDIDEEVEKLNRYKEALAKIVSKTVEAVEEGYGLELEDFEIQQDFLEEYIYLLCNIRINGNRLDIKELFDEPADFVILLANLYGEKVRLLIRDILNNDLEGFNYYFI